MKLMTKAIMNKIPALYSQEGKGDDAIVHVKFFTPTSNWTWYATEASAIMPDGSEKPLSELDSIDEAEDVLFFGLVEGFEKELGNFVLSELKTIKGRFGLGVERDTWFDKGQTIGTVRKL